MANALLITGAGGSAKKLYDALQYSGLVTEKMSFDEMCEVLSEKYTAYFDFTTLNKEDFNVPSNVSFKKSDTAPYITVEVNNSYQLVKQKNGIDISPFNKFTVSYVLANGISNEMRYQYIALVDADTNTTLWSEYGTYDTNGATINREIDVSSFTSKNVVLHIKVASDISIGRCLIYAARLDI